MRNWLNEKSSPQSLAFECLASRGGPVWEGLGGVSLGGGIFECQSFEFLLCFLLMRCELSATSAAHCHAAFPWWGWALEPQTPEKLAFPICFIRAKEQ